MPQQDQNPGLFYRWLWLVYLPLSAFALLLVGLVAGLLSGGWVWLALLLGAYCLIPARLLLETRRKGLGFPKPPARSRTPRTTRSAAPKAAAKADRTATGTQAESPASTPARFRRRRAFVALLGIGLLVALGGVLVIVGIGRATSSSGIALVGVGGFLMILSVTLPAFKIVDSALKAIGRLLKRKPAGRPKRSPRRS